MFLNNQFSLSQVVDTSFITNLKTLAYVNYPNLGFDVFLCRYAHNQYFESYQSMNTQELSKREESRCEYRKENRNSGTSRNMSFAN